MKTINLHTAAFTGLLSLAIFSPAMAADFSGSLKGVTITDSQEANKPPVAAFTYTISGDTITFDASESYDPDGNIENYVWNIDGNITGEGSALFTSSKISNGKEVLLTITDNAGGVSILRKIVTETDSTIKLANDDFSTYKHATDLSTTTNWKGLTGQILCLLSDTIRGNVNNGFSATYWGANSFNANQYAEATIDSSAGGTNFGGVSVRGGLSGSSKPQFYALVTNVNSTIRLYSYNGDHIGSEVTLIASYPQVMSARGKVKLEVTGTGASIRLAAYYDADGASGWTALATGVDPTDDFDTGVPGVAYWGNIAGANITDWTGGNL